MAASGALVTRPSPHSTDHFPVMKKLLILLGALVALATGYFLQSELAGTKTELAAVQEKVRLVEQQRVPRAEFEQARATVAAAQEKAAALTQELQGVREQLAAALDRAAAAERRMSQTGAKTPAPVLALTLVKGTYTVQDDTILYSPDAQLSLGNGITISSPSGRMLSDKEHEIVAGNLVVETPGTAVQPARDPSAAPGGKPAQPAETAGTPKP